MGSGAEAEMTGRTISHYEILEKLGAGGMGVVYKAHDTRLDRLVALKFPPPHLSADPAEKHRFIQEARAASALDHPNIGVVHDIDETPEGQMFIAMAYHEGQTLKQKIADGLSVSEAIEIAHQIAQGIAKAHEHGIVHRDIKPGNVILTTDGVAKIIDFGLAKLAGATVTLNGTTKGTVGYMSPEQALGKQVDHRTDLWSLGVVLYEMLAGRRPFPEESQAALLHAIAYEAPKPLREVSPDAPEAVVEIVERALQKDRDRRYSSAAEMAKDLAACQAAPPVPSRLRLWLTPRVAIPALLIVLVLLVAGAWLYQRSARVRWAREQALPEITQLANKGRYVAAFRLARQAERYLPADPGLARLWDDVSRQISIQTDPPGADVEMKEYSAPEDQWMYVGRAPMEKARVPLGYFRWKVSKPGLGTLYGASATWADRRFKLDPEGAVPAGMVRVPGGMVSYTLSNLGQLGPFSLEPYFIDRHEVTNKQFKAFVDAGGYQKREYWKQPFVKDGRVLSWEQAMAQFRDATGRPGPATWELGRYPDGQDHYPVAGVSWYEAAAYAEFAGNSLPTIAHWYRAAEPNAGLYIVPLSNFGSAGPAPVEKYQGIGPYGTYDMAGNVKEWCWNETGNNLRFILGGAWREPSYQFNHADAQSPFDRSPTNGFRCVRCTAPVAEALTAPKQRQSRDYGKEKPVSDEVFRIYKSMYAYDRTALNARIESVDDSSEYWRKEKVSFDAAYGNERVPAYLFLPKHAAPPYQTVVLFPGVNVLLLASSKTLAGMHHGDYVVRSGRALLYPIYNETYERRPNSPDAGSTGSAGNSLIHRRDRMIQWSKDLGRSLDYLETRKDIDRSKFAYLGVSLGSATGLILAALDERLKVCVFLDGGVYLRQTLAEADQLNFAPRLKAPTLMVNGRHDFTFPLETSQRPMFRLLGTPAKDKRHVIFDTAHDVSVMRNDTIREVLNWLDRYLGKVN
jgi:formylglycine-generating enzyme required for sulfatase activity/dienelactone hydrolase